MWVVQTRVVRWFRASAITAWPVVLVDPASDTPTIRKHEGVHYAQQRRWALWGLGVGLVVWWLLYLVVLPVGWNWWRWRWEREAYLAQGFTAEEIAGVLREPPYYLWWM